MDESFAKNRNGKAEAVSSSLILIFSGVVAVLMSTLLFYGAIKVFSKHIHKVFWIL